MAVDPDPAPLPQAATLILVRQHGGELQTYLLRRSPSSGFMPGLFVFPGGRVDPADGDEAFWAGHSDLRPAALADRLGRRQGACAALRAAVAAIRETYEEAGILLASGAEGGPAARIRADERRRQEGLPAGWLRYAVEEEGWTLSLSALWPWAHWITPVGMPRRFDTRFFVATVPEGQVGQPDLHETVEGLWIAPHQALRQNMGGKTPLSPPTLVTLHALLGYATLDQLRQELVNRDWGPPIFPRLIPLEKGRGAVILEPWDPMYGHAEEALRIDAENLAERLLPAGAPFSRLWNHEGVWRPVDLT